jgi:hypothetical protein
VSLDWVIRKTRWMKRFGYKPSYKQADVIPLKVDHGEPIKTPSWEGTVLKDQFQRHDDLPVVPKIGGDTRD